MSRFDFRGVPQFKRTLDLIVSTLDAIEGQGEPAPDAAFLIELLVSTGRMSKVDTHADLVLMGIGYLCATNEIEPIEGDFVIGGDHTKLHWRIKR